ncbi:hypothetical protein HanPSC8_Chr01g0035641 [Helianthus annuus]|nr:hypothetical protein HanIR_Chr01g0041081 [Helianthus annuus]KAJ0958137.1 hypothetical protein HanPSC8_Chr01g0035641 [Helianthus annuus]
MSGEEILRYYHMNGKNRGFTVDRRGIIRVGLVPPPEILEHIDNPSVLIGRTWKAGERLIRFEEVAGTHRSPSPSPTNPTGSNTNQQQLLITLHMGGTWSKQKYVATQGSGIKKRLLRIPLTSSLSDLTYSELIDHVKREAGSFGNEKLTYKSSKPVLGMCIQGVRKVDFLALTIKSEWNMKPFLDRVAELLALSKPVDLYLG